MNQDNQDTAVSGAPPEEAPSAVAETPPAAEAEDLAGKLAQVTAERDQLAQEKAELHDRLLRRQADFENFRKRMESERSEFLQFSGMELVREVLPVLDDFERAIKVDCLDGEYRKGVELIYQRLFESLKKLGLEPIESAGRTFDPNLHQAVVREETAEVSEHAILEEFQRGYNYKGRLVRPAMVKVAVRPPEPEASD